MNAASLAAVLHLAAAMLDRIRTSGAVPAAEFGPARAAYALVPYLRIATLAALIFVLAQALFFRSGRRRVLTVAPAVPALLLLSMRALGDLEADLVVGLLLTVLAVVAWAVRPFSAAGGTGARPTAGFSAGALSLRALRSGLLAFAAGTFAAALSGLAETVLVLPRFVPTLLLPEWMGDLRSAVIVLAGYLGLEIAIVTAMISAVSDLATGVARRIFPGRAQEAGLRACALVAGAAIGGTLVFAPWLGLADEMSELGITTPAVLLGLTLAIVVAGAIERRFLVLSLHRRASEDDGPQGPPLSQLLQLAFLPPDPFPGSPVDGWILRHRRRRNLALLATGSALIAVLSLALYPEVEDFRAELFDGYARVQVAIVSLLLAWAACADLWSRRRLNLVALGSGLALLLLPFLTGRVLARPVIRLAVAEYTRFASLAFESPLVRSIVEFKELGLEPPPPGSSFPLPLHKLAARDRAPADPAPDPPAIVLVIWDAARPDHLGPYGYPRPTTPRLDAYAARATVFRRAYAHATATTASMRHLLTGRYSSRAMLATDHDAFFLKELAENGTHTAIVTATGSDRNGVSLESFRRNWDAAGLNVVAIHSDPDAARKGDAERVDAVIREWTRIAGATKQRALRGTFTFCHLLATHAPWLASDGAMDFGASPHDLYDGEVAKADACFGRLLDALAALGMSDDTLVILTADHGTGLLDHGRYAGFLAYEEQIRVPLVIGGPGIPAHTVDDVVGLIDIAPTLAAIHSQRAATRFHGRSLWPLLTGSVHNLEPRPLVSLCAFRDSFALIDVTARWKFIHHRGWKYDLLYDLENDPLERRPCNDAEPEVLDSLRRQMDAFLHEGRGRWAVPDHYRR